MSPFAKGALGTSSAPLRVVLATPTYTRPLDAYLAAMEASVPALDAAGIEHSAAFRIGSPYISHARSELARRAMDAQADVIVFIDHDLSWDPQDLVRLISTPGDVVSGLYRFKKADEQFMGALDCRGDGTPITRPDGCIKASRVPGGFLKVTKEAIDTFMRAYPELVYGPRFSPSVDLFNHGAFEGVWWGEDYAFSRNWIACGGDIWVVPDLNLVHHSADQAYLGNLHQSLLRQPGGSLDPERFADVA